MLKFLKRLFAASPKGVCRYCMVETDPDKDMCPPCWANNNAW